MLTCLAIQCISEHAVEILKKAAGMESPCPVCWNAGGSSGSVLTGVQLGLTPAVETKLGPKFATFCFSFEDFDFFFLFCVVVGIFLFLFASLSVPI